MGRSGQILATILALGTLSCAGGKKQLNTPVPRPLAPATKVSESPLAPVEIERLPSVMPSRFSGSAYAALPNPRVKLSLSPAEIRPGESATLRWSVSHASRVAIEGIGTVDDSGSITVKPDKTMTYRLIADNYSSRIVATTQIIVRTSDDTTMAINPGEQITDERSTASSPKADQPGTPLDVPTGPLVHINVEPSEIVKGGHATLSWYATDARQVTITGIGFVPPVGSLVIEPTTTTTYILKGEGEGVYVSAKAVVIVRAHKRPSNSGGNTTSDNHIIPVGSQREWIELPDSLIQHRAPSKIAPAPTSFLVGVPTDDELIEAEMERLHQGMLAYNAPYKMKMGKVFRLIAKIGSDQVTVEKLAGDMPSTATSKISVVTTPVTTKMKMTLTSSEFAITKLSSEEQIVSGDQPTTWEWDISPKHSGSLSLHLAAVIELKQGSRDYQTVDRTIMVEVDPIGEAENFAKANGVWILTTFGAGIAGFWEWLRKRKKKQEDSPSWLTPD